MKTVTFYGSAICPRCALVRRSLKGMRADFPDVRVEKVEFLTGRARAREDGVGKIPTLVAGDRRLSGFVLTSGRIRSFLESL